MISQIIECQIFQNSGRRLIWNFGTKSVIQSSVQLPLVPSMSHTLLYNNTWQVFVFLGGVNALHEYSNQGVLDHARLVVGAAEYQFSEYWSLVEMEIRDKSITKINAFKISGLNGVKIHLSGKNAQDNVAFHRSQIWIRRIWHVFWKGCTHCNFSHPNLGWKGSTKCPNVLTLNHHYQYLYLHLW